MYVYIGILCDIPRSVPNLVFASYIPILPVLGHFWVCTSNLVQLFTSYVSYFT